VAVGGGGGGNRKRERGSLTLQATFAIASSRKEKIKRKKNTYVITHIYKTTSSAATKTEKSSEKREMEGKSDYAAWRTAPASSVPPCCHRKGREKGSKEKKKGEENRALQLLF